MRSQTKLLTLGFLLASVAGSAVAASVVRGESAVPTGARLEQYPLERGPLSVTREAALGLKPMMLTTPWTGYNHYRGLRGGRWVLETLPAGTLVLADAVSNPVYKADCGNRLVGVTKCPTCPPVTAGGSTNPVGGNNTGSGGSDSGNGLASADPGFWARHPNFRNFMEHLGMLALGLLGLLAIVLLLLFTAWLVSRIIDAINDERARRRQGAVPPPQPPAAAPPAAAPPAPGPTGPQPVPPPPDDAPPAQNQPGYVSFYDGGVGGEHKVNHAGQQEVHLIEHGDGRFTMRWLRKKK